MDKSVKFLSLNIYVLYILLWIKYWLMWFESLLVKILFKFKKRPIYGIRVVILIEINSALVSIRDLFKNVNVKSNVKFFLQLNFWTVEYFDCFPQ